MRKLVGRKLVNFHFDYECLFFGLAVFIIMKWNFGRCYTGGYIDILSSFLWRCLQVLACGLTAVFVGGCLRGCYRRKSEINRSSNHVTGSKRVSFCAGQVPDKLIWSSTVRP